MQRIICQICGWRIETGPVESCERCETPHHKDCWEFNGGCAVYACNPHTRAQPIKKAGALSWGLRLPLLGALIVALGVYEGYRPPPEPARIVATAQEGTGTIPLGKGTSHGVVGPRVGQIAPDFTISDLTGESMALSEIRDGRVTILTFWLAYCPDCMPHVPSWAKIYQKYAENEKLALVNVSAFAQNAESTKRFCKEHAVGGTVLLDGRNIAVPLYQLGTITTFIIDRSGVIRYRGSQRDAALDRVEAALEPILAQG